MANVILLGLNLGLVGVIACLTFLLKSRPALPPSYITETKTVTNIAVRKVNPPLNLTGLLDRPLNWNAFESTNYVTYIANLRAFGCPEETIRDIIIADIAKLYTKRRAALRARLPKPEYWQPLDTWATDSPDHQEIRRQLRALDEEERLLVKELLGVDYKTELAKYGIELEETERDYAFLPEEKRNQVADLLRKFDAMEAEFYARTKGLMLPEDEAALTRIEKQREAELAKLLTPEELVQYELRNSPTAQNLRSELQGFNPTAEEFGKIFQLQKVFKDAFSRRLAAEDSVDVEARERAQEEAQRVLNEEIRRTLGDQRYAQYERSQDSDYRTLVQLADRFELPTEVAGKVYGMKQAAEKQRNQVARDPNLSEDQRLAALMAIERETEKSVAGALGEKVFSKYREVGGSWIWQSGVSDVLSNNENDIPE